MVPSFLRINAVTRANREEMIARARSALSAGGAWVVSVKLFSNASVSFNFEIPGSLIERLREALAATELLLTKQSQDSFASLVDSDSLASDDIAGSLQITFIHNDPDLKIDVPPIPG